MIVRSFWTHQTVLIPSYDRWRTRQKSSSAGGSRGIESSRKRTLNALLDAHIVANQTGPRPSVRLSQSVLGRVQRLEWNSKRNRGERLNLIRLCSPQLSVSL